jgi:hypothetical protein
MDLNNNKTQLIEWIENPYSQTLYINHNNEFEIHDNLGIVSFIKGLVLTIFSGYWVCRWQVASKLYTEGLKNRELAKEAPQIFWPERETMFKNMARSEDEKNGVKPTPAKTDYSVTMCISKIPFEKRPVEQSKVMEAKAAPLSSHDALACWVKMVDALKARNLEGEEYHSKQLLPKGRSFIVC